MRTRFLSISFFVFFAACLLSAGPASPATSGLPFIEDFSDTNLMDGSATTADWDIEEQALALPWRTARYGAFAEGIASGSDITGYIGNTRAIALGDVDGDGDVDLFVGNDDDQVNRLYLNNGDGTTWNGTDIASDTHKTAALAIGDLDGDGDMDMVAANRGQRNRVYLNNGDGTAWTSSDLSASEDNSLAVVLADINEDGHLDAIVGNDGEPVRIYLNNGTAAPFSGASVSDVAADTDHTVCLAVGDVDADGDLDIVAGRFMAQRNRLYLNDGDGASWTPSDIGTETDWTFSVALGDMDADGDLDLVTGNKDAPNRLYVNNGSLDPFNSVSARDISSDSHHTRSIVLCDVDFDGDLDVIAGNRTAATNRMYLNNGTSTPFNETVGRDVTTDAHETDAIAVGDVDGDGAPDLIAGNYGQMNRLYLNPASPNPWFGVNGSDISTDEYKTQAVALGDMDGDGDLDLVAGQNEQICDLIYLNDGSEAPFAGATGSTIGATTNRGTLAVALGDVDSDGDLDLMTGRGGNKQSLLFLNNGTSAPFAGVSGIAVGPPEPKNYGVAFGDMDRDGDLDLVLGYYSSTQPNQLFLNNGTSDPFNAVSGLDITITPTMSQTLILADFNSDGHLDIAEANSSSTPNRIYINNGSADPFSGVPGWDISADADSTLGLAVGDVDGDGDLDVVAGNGDAPNRLYLNEGGPTPLSGVSGSDITSDNDETRDIALVDVDGDGDLDVIAGNKDVPNRLYLNNGGAAPFSNAVGLDITSDASDSESLAVGDVDNDGDLDLVAGNDNYQRNRLYLNLAADGEGLHPWNAHALGGEQIVTNPEGRPRGMELGDLDHDGDLDLVTVRWENGVQTSFTEVFLNNGTRDPWAGVTPVTAASESFRVMHRALGDMNGDGCLDIVVGYGRHNEDDVNRVYLNDGTGTGWTGHDITADGDGTVGVALGDLNGDGALDVVTANYWETDRDATNRVYLNDGTGTGWTRVNLPGGSLPSNKAAVGDVDNDGDLDIAISNYAWQAGKGVNIVCINDGTGAGWTTANITNEDLKTESIDLADMDGDGDLDVVAASVGETDAPRLYVNDGTGTGWTRTDISATTAQTRGAAIADLDGDGDLDVVTTVKWRAYLNNGTSTPFSSGLEYPIGSYLPKAGQIAVGDVDNDGGLDLLLSVETYDTSLYRRIDYQTGPCQAVSLKVNDTETGFSSVSFNSVTAVPTNTTIDFWLTNDGGAKWFLAKPNSNFVFPGPGDDLRWRAELRSLSPVLTPQVHSLDLYQNNPFIQPAVPNVTTEQNAPKQLDLTAYENDIEDSGPDLNWSIDPSDCWLYDAAIDANDLLTVTPKLNQFGEVVATLTLIDSDMLTAAQDITIYVGTPLTPPTAFIFPPDPVETDDLICGLFPGTVGEGLTAMYEYTWADGTTTIVHGPKVELVDTLESSYTSAGDEWTCTVRTFDGSDYSDPCVPAESGVIRGLGESILTLNASPATITLGQYVALSGSITPAVMGAHIFFDGTETPADNTDTKPPTLVTNYLGTYTHGFLPDEAGSWALHAEWLGNEDVSGDSDVAGVTVNRALPTLSFELSHSSVPLGFEEVTATATFDAPIPAALESLLSGKTVRVWAKKPDASAAGPMVGVTGSGGTVTFEPADFAAAGMVFDEPGTWQFLAEFEGDKNFLPATSTSYNEPESVRLTVRDKAGYAVICVGRLNEDGEGLPEHQKTADYVYRVFRDRGFAHEDIYYLREGPQQPYIDIFVDDTSPSQMGLRYAIQTWAAGRMNQTAAPLYVVLMDHGGDERFYVYSSGYDETRIVTATELDGYLDTLQAALDLDAEEEDVVVVYGACRSGSVIEHVGGPYRTIITSASPDEASHRGPEDPADGIRDGEAFVKELFRYAGEGKNLKESFELASEKLYEYTETRSNRYRAYRRQHPLLDDTGDGAGSPSPLSVQPGYDGHHAHEVILGYGVNAPGAVGWTTVTQTVHLDPAEPMGQLFAKATDVPATGHFAWLEVKTPAYDDSTPIEDLTNDDPQQVVAMPAFDYEPGISDLDSGYFRWQSFGAIFDAPGVYKVFYYVRDGDTGEVSAHMLTTVYRAATDNTPPAPVTLSYPANGALVYTTAFFAWTDSADPDGDDVTYRLELATDETFSTNLSVYEDIVQTVTSVSGLLDGQTYWWRVIPVDQYGATPSSNPARTFAVDQDNPDDYGMITGTVTDAFSEEPVVGAAVESSGGALSTTTNTRGEYFIDNVPVGSYTLEATMTNYVGQAAYNVLVDAGAMVEVNFELTPNDTFLWGDVTADGVAGTVDGSFILQWYLGLIDRFPIDETIVNPDYPPCADVSADGKVGGMDASFILQKRVGLIDCFPADADCDQFGPDAKRNVILKGIMSEVTRFVTIAEVPAAKPGEEVDVPIMIDDASSVLTYYVRLQYDPSALEFVDVIAGDVTADWWAPTIKVEHGETVIVCAGPDALTGSGVLAHARFTVLDAASASIVLDKIELNDGRIPAAIE